MSARRGLLERARRMLGDGGIACRASRPRRAEGILRVAARDAARARALLADAFGREVVVGPEEAAWFRCHACGRSLSQGARTCPDCGALVGDPHGG